MTAPRQIVPGAVYLVTRRCAQRQYLLRPSQLTNAIFQFVLAVAARRCGIRVHAFCVLSNHFHILLTDTEARLPEFHQFLDALVARAVNALHGRWESFWAPNSYSAVRVVSPDDIVEKAAYVLANPVAAGLVRSGREWPGLWSDPELITGGTLKADRPRHFFAEKGSLPATAELQLTAPAGFESAEDFKARVLAALARHEREARDAVGGVFLGAKKVLRQNPLSRPASPEPRRKLNPRIACRDKWKRIEALSRQTEFVKSYRAALTARRRGEPGVVFPAGTYLLRIAHGVPCAPFA